MKEFRYRLLLTILAILVLAQMLTPVAFADTTSAEGYDEYYCRTALSALPNSTALLYAYDAIVAGVESSSTEISVYDGVHPLAMSELDAVLDAYRRDHAEHFWFGNSYRISYNGSTILAVIPTYVMEGAALAAARLAFDAAIAEMLTAVDGTMSEFERERILHDRLAARVQYAESANAHNAYGALVEGIAVGFSLCLDHALYLGILYAGLIHLHPHLAKLVLVKVAVHVNLVDGLELLVANLYVNSLCELLLCHNLVPLIGCRPVLNCYCFIFLMQRYNIYFIYASI